MVPPSRQASRRSRSSRASAARIMRRAPCRRARADAQISSERRVARHHHEPARCEMIFERQSSSLSEAASSETCGSSSSQIGRGAVSTRESPSRRFWPADSRPAGMSRKRAEPEGGERRVDAPVVRPEEAAPEGDVLSHGEARFHRVEVADIVALLGELGIGRAALEAEAPGGRRQQAGDLRNRVVLPAPLGPCSSSASPGPTRESQAVEQGPAAALAAQVISGEADPMRHLLGFCAS